MNWLAPIDYERIRDEVWERLAAAVDDPGAPLRLFAVATKDDVGKPDVRILTLTGVVSERGALWFHSDRRSKKIEQILKCPDMAAVVYDWREGIQLRIQGQASLHNDDSIVDLQWGRLDSMVQYAYGLSQQPGEPLANTSPCHPRHPHVGAADQIRGRANFVVIEFLVDAIDWLQLSDSGDRRARLQRTDGWRTHPLAP
jgi:general stress protein 26